MSSAAALQLVNPWHVTDVEFRDTDAGGREPRIMIVFAPGSRFHCPEAGCGEEVCPVYDTMERTWCHLNFFQYKAFIHAGVPRVACPEHGVRTVPVPWARPGGGVRAPVRGDGRGTGEKPAGRGHRRTGRRARHETEAVHPPLRGRGAPVRGPHGRGSDRHRRDQPQGTPVHHRRRQPDGAQRDQRDAGQGLDHGETIRVGFHGAQRRPEPRAPGDVRHGPGVRQGRPPMASQRREGDRQVPCDQARQRGRRQGRESRGQGEPAAQTHEVPVARERVQPHGLAAGGQAQSGEAAVEDRQGVRDARMPAGHPRRQRQPRGGGGRVQGVVLMDDAFPPGTDEGPRPTIPAARERHPRVFRQPLHQRDPRRPEQHHPARQDPSPWLQKHGPPLHDDLPDLRQTRPQHRHHLNGLTHTKQRKALFDDRQRGGVCHPHPADRGLRGLCPVRGDWHRHCSQAVNWARNMLFTLPVMVRYRGLRHLATLFVRVHHRCLDGNFIGMLIYRVYH